MVLNIEVLDIDVVVVVFFIILYALFSFVVTQDSLVGNFKFCFRINLAEGELMVVQSGVLDF